MPEAQALLGHLQHLRPDLDDVARKQLLLVGNILLHAGHAVALAAQISRRETDLAEQHPVRLVEFDAVGCDVHVSDVVAVPGIDCAAIGH
jgi:hypothetical protein